MSALGFTSRTVLELKPSFKPEALAKRANLRSERSDKLNDLLADHVMENVDLITSMLRDKSPVGQIDQKFTAQDAALQQQVEALLGQTAPPSIKTTPRTCSAASRLIS
jgi:hypothetical protein